MKQTGNLALTTGIEAEMKEIAKKSMAVLLSVFLGVTWTSPTFATESAVRDFWGLQVYKPSTDTKKYITEMVQAKLLTSEVYNKSFQSDLLRGDLAAYVMKLYSYLGGADPGTPGDHYTDTADVNAEKAYQLGFFPDPEGEADDEDVWFYPADPISKSEALSVLAKCVVKALAKDGEVPAAIAAASLLRSVYRDVATVEENHLSDIAFLYQKGALLLLPGEQAGQAQIYADELLTRNEFFLLLSDVAWIFAKKQMEPYGIKPDNAVSAGYQRDAYKNNTDVWWEGGSNIYAYGVSVYVKKKLKVKLTVGDTLLHLDKATKPTYKAVFGNLKKKQACFLKVQALDRHKLKSKKTLKVPFFAEKFANVNQKMFGRNKFGFKNAKAAKKYQKTIKVKIWKLKKGKKVRSSMKLTVNKEIAGELKSIFKEIYKGKEKFPIKVMGGFSIRSSKTSEHNHGSAIDINPDENCMKDGKKVVVGRFWKPGKNKYSIKKNGDVVKAFERYGWYWGGNGWGDRKDYMHFSFFGT